MHRLLVLTCIISIAAGLHPWPFARRHKSSALAAVNEIKGLLIDVERKMQKFCRLHTDRALTETYGANHYRLTANLTGCREKGLEVRAGQRLVAVQARDSRCDYIALRLLPDVVDGNSAFWRFERGQLSILFPYIPERSRCGRVVSDAVHSVPKINLDTDGSDYPDIDVRLGDIDLGKALQNYKMHQG